MQLTFLLALLFVVVCGFSEADRQAEASTKENRMFSMLKRAIHPDFEVRERLCGRRLASAVERRCGTCTEEAFNPSYACSVGYTPSGFVEACCPIEPQ